MHEAGAVSLADPPANCHVETMIECALIPAQIPLPQQHRICRGAPPSPLLSPAQAVEIYPGKF